MGQPVEMQQGDDRVVATLYPATVESLRRTVVLAGAMAAPQRYLRRTADWLASAGYDVLSFDYRGVGESAPWGRPTTNLDHWGSDLELALRTAAQRFQPEQLLLVGHSLGGMLLGHAGVGERVDGAVLVGATHGVTSHYRGRGRLRVELAYRVLPWIARRYHGLPPSRFLLGAGAPRDAIVHWTRWGRGQRFVHWDGSSSAPNFLRYNGPILSVVPRDDDYAPPGAVDALLAAFPRAGCRREVVQAPIPLGHFGLFTARDVWCRHQLGGWLEDVSRAALAPPRKKCSGG